MPITTMLTSGLGLLLLVLASRVIKQRRDSSISLGSGEDEMLLRRMRGQANFIEYSLMFILLMGLAEYQGGNFIFLSIMGLIFFLARCAHGYALGFTEKNVPMRFFGTVATFSCLGLMCIHNLLMVTGILTVRLP